MENQQAIEILKESKRQSEVILQNPTVFYSEKQIVGGCETMKKNAEAYQMAVAALEKQIPKKPVTHKDTNRADCPVCGATVRGIKEPFGDWCSKCGQKLERE